MAPAVPIPKSRAASAKLRPPLPSSHSSTSASSRSIPVPPVPPVPTPPVRLQLPQPLPTRSELQNHQNIVPSPALIAERLASLAHAYISLCSSSDTSDLLSWEVDLCSATFYASYAVCLDPLSTRARMLLARCARLGGFNVALPMSPSGSASSSSVSATKLNSFDNKDHASAQACIHILQQGSAATFQDPGCAKEYREACRVLGRNADALQVSGLLNEKAQGKRKALDDIISSQIPPEPVSSESRYRSQLATDDAFESSRRNQMKQSELQFGDALAQDPLNWRAWAGMCDALSNASSVPQAFNDNVSALDKLYARLELDILVPYIKAEAAVAHPSVSTAPEKSTATDMVRKISEDGMNKKLKVASDRPSTLTATQRKPTNKVAPPAPTTAQSTVTATRLHPASRALSAAQINTTQTRNTSTHNGDVKVAVKPVPEAPRTARIGSAGAGVPANNAATTTAGRQLRSTASRGPDSAVPLRGTAPAAPSSGRPGATSQAGSVSSASSGSTVTSATSRATSSTLRGTASTRRAPASTTASSHNAQRSVSGKSAASGPAPRSNSAASANPAARTPATTRPPVGSRPPSSMSKSSNTSASTARVNGTSTNSSSIRSTSAAQTAAVEREAAAAATASRVKLEQLVQLRETCLEKLKTLAQYHTIDIYIVGLLYQVGEAYRLLRLCQGDSAAQILKQPVLTTMLAKSPQEDRTADVKSLNSLVSRLEEHTAAKVDPFVQNSILHHLLFARAYAECSQYASAELHFTHVRSLNPFVTAHMDIFSLVLFHLSREVTLSALAQHLVLVSPASASTQIVVGNAFSLQKEHQTALICFQRAAAAAPDYAYAYTLAGHEAYDIGLLDEAIAYFRSAIRCDRRHWNGWAGLGRVFLEIGDHEHAACKSLQMAIEINSSNYLLWDLVGWTFSLISAPVKALECYDRAIELAPRASVLTYLRRAELLLQNGQQEASHRNLVLAHDLAPEEASIHILLAQSYMRLGGGEFCHLETPASMSHKNGANAPGPLRATGSMVHPTVYQAELTHHLAVAVDLDPTLLRVVKSIGEGHKTLPGHAGASAGYRRHQFDPHDMASLQDIQAPSFTRSDVSHAESLSADLDASHLQYSTSRIDPDGQSHTYGLPSHGSVHFHSPQQQMHAGMSTPQTRAHQYQYADPSAANSSAMSFSTSTTRTPAGLPVIAIDHDTSH